MVLAAAASTGMKPRLYLSWFGWPTLLDDPTPLSSYWKLNVLKDTNDFVSNKWGWSLLKDSSTPLPDKLLSEVSDPVVGQVWLARAQGRSDARVGQVWLARAQGRSDAFVRQDELARA